MTLTIGRTTFPNSMRPGFTSAGDRIGFVIHAAGITPAATRIMIQQVVGLAGNADEEIVPVAWSVDPHLDGFYRVLSSSVTPSRGYRSGGGLVAEIQLERVTGGWAKPIIEISSQWAVMANGHGVTGRATRAVPTPVGATRGAEVTPGPNWLTGSAVATATGNVLPMRSTTLPGSGVASYTCEANRFYNGAATIEIHDGDFNWYTVVGKQIPIVPAGAWRISNGLLRFTPDVVSGVRVCRVDQWVTGTTWSLVFYVQPGIRNGGAWTAGPFGTPEQPNAVLAGDDFSQPVIVRNSPEVATVMIPQNGGAQQSITIRRGLNHAHFVFQDEPTQTMLHGLGSQAAAASTDGTSHVRRTATGSDQWFISTPGANNVDTTNGRIAVDSAVNTAVFGVGLYSADEVTASLTAVAERQLVAAR